MESYKSAIMNKLLLSALLIILLGSCSPSTQIVKSWKDPAGSISSQSPDTKILVVALVKDESSRRVIEDELVKRLKGKGEVSYNTLTTELIKNADQSKLNETIQQGHYTHILLMSLADVEKETSYVPGTTTAYYGGYGMYYGHGAGFYSSPGYYTTDKNYFVETTVYSTNPDKLLWTGTSKTVNPSKIQKAVNEIADAVTEQMKKEGFIK
jgi:hypothetical protein